MLECNSAVSIARCDNALPHQCHERHVLLAMESVLQDYVNAKRAEHAALNKDYQAFTDAKKAVETAKERTKEVKEVVKNARAAVREALKTVSDPPAVVSRHPASFSHCHCCTLHPASALTPSKGMLVYGVLQFVRAWREGRLNAALLFQEMVHIHPNQEFLGPKESFRVDVASLDALLSYTEKDDREPAFEVSVFAELFREMLEVRFGRGILRTLELLERQDRQVRAAPPHPRFWPAPLTSHIMGLSRQLAFSKVPHNGEALARASWACQAVCRAQNASAGPLRAAQSAVMIVCGTTCRQGPGRPRSAKPRRKLRLRQRPRPRLLAKAHPPSMALRTPTKLQHPMQLLI